MIKKKLSILLLLLLAVLFIGLFSISYARELSATEIKNAIKNCYQQKINATIASNHLNNINNVDLSGWVDVISRYQGKYFITFQVFNGRVLTNLYCYSGTKLTLTTQNGQNAVQTANGTLFSSQFDCSSSAVDAWNNAAIQQFPYTWAYFESGIYQNSNTYFIQPYTYIPNNKIFNTGYMSDIFEFTPLSNNFEICSINGLTQPSQVYVYDRNNIDYVTLGYLEKFSNLDNISITRYRYNKANGWIMTSEYTTDNFEGYNVQNDILTYTIDVSKISADTLVIFNFTPNNIEDFTNQTFALYVKSPFTYISNGIIYPDKTFSGDYYNNYNDDNNTDKIVDQNKEDTEGIKDFLKDTYDKMFTVSGEEINSIVNNAISKINIESGELVETTIILDYLNRQPGDFVISWNDMTTHFSIQNQQLDNQLTIPTRQINFSELERNSLELQEVMRWERIIINIGIFSILLHEIYILFLKTIGVGIDIYGDKQEEKATLKAAQQREKATIRRQMFNANQERLREYEKMARKKGWKK